MNIFIQILLMVWAITNFAIVIMFLWSSKDEEAEMDINLCNSSLKFKE